jgi:hypothetical protein
MPILDSNAPKRKAFIHLAKKYSKPGSGSHLSILKKRTWNFILPNLKQIITRSPFVVVGGVATRLYMPERMTLDLDILIRDEDAATVHQDLIQSRSILIGQLNIPGTTWKLSDDSILDVLEGSEIWVSEALYAPNIAPDGLPIIDLPYLVLMKLIAGRSQDLADISRMVGGANDRQIAQIKDMVLKYLPSAIEDLESLLLLGKLEFQE